MKEKLTTHITVTMIPFIVVVNDVAVVDDVAVVVLSVSQECS